MKRIYEEKFLRENKDKTPEQIIQDLRRKAIATTSRLMEEGRQEKTVLSACKVILDRTDPPKQIQENQGEITINLVSYADGKPKPKGRKRK